MVGRSPLSSSEIVFFNRVLAEKKEKRKKSRTNTLKSTLALWQTASISVPENTRHIQQGQEWRQPREGRWAVFASGASFREGLGTPQLPVISDELTLYKCYFFLILRSLCSYTCRHGKLRVWEGVWFC